MTRPEHRMIAKQYTHNGRLQKWWECTAGDWLQEHIENQRTVIGPKLARERFEAHLPKPRKPS